MYACALLPPSCHNESKSAIASTREYLDFVLEQLSPLGDVTFRPMMREYILYYRGKVVGGLYDDRLLVKPVPSALALMPHAERELPYPGAKEMLRVENVDDRTFLAALFSALYTDLPAPKPKRPRH